MNRLQLLRATTLCAALALAGNTSHAQLSQGETPAADRVLIPLRNAPPEFVAYWLDPVHQPAPIQIRHSQNSQYPNDITGELPRQPGNGNGPRDLKLPAGVAQVVAIPPQKALLARGTAAGLEELKKLVNELDVPIRQVEIEAQFCEMSPQALKTLPLKFATSKGAPYAASVALVPQGFTADLNRLMAANQLRVLTAPRVTAIDGLTAQLTSTESHGMALSPQIEKPTDTLEANKQWTPGFSVVEVETGLNCTPILQGDLIKLFTRSTLNNRSANVNATLRDGETIAIAMPTENSDAVKRVVIFLTARIVPRAGDEIARAPETGATQLGMIR